MSETVGSSTWFGSVENHVGRSLACSPTFFISSKSATNLRVVYATAGMEICGSHPSQRARRMRHPAVRDAALRASPFSFAWVDGRQGGCLQQTEAHGNH
jgi:hypothetical protein